jgi:hypothetical protein
MADHSPSKQLGRELVETHKFFRFPSGRILPKVPQSVGSMNRFRGTLPLVLPQPLNRRRNILALTLESADRRQVRAAHGEPRPLELPLDRLRSVVRKKKCRNRLFAADAAWVEQEESRTGTSGHQVQPRRTSQHRAPEPVVIVA